jgi:hypothetical protein
MNMEKRVGDWLEKWGPDRVTLWLAQFAVLLFCLIFFWPRIRERLHQWRTPKTQTSQTSQTPPAAPAPVPSANTGGGPNSGGTGAAGNQSGGKAGGAAKGNPVNKPPLADASGFPPSRSSRRSGNPPSAPTEVHVDVRSPDIIVLSWRAVGPKVTYNAYSSATPQLTNLRKENEKPLHQNVATWRPETGLDVYWVVITAVDEQGNESAYSEAVQVIRHPQPPSDNNGLGSKLLDKAGDALQKYVP